jgi:hypothetical protein
MKKKIKLSPIFSIIFFSLLFLFLGFRDKYIYPYLDHLKLNSPACVEEIKTKQGQDEHLKDKVVWHSKRLKIQPPEIDSSQELAQKVLAADPNTWVDINLSSQTLCLFHGGGTNCFAVSTGMPWTPTPTGTFSIWTKLSSTLMAGPGYYLPGVPWTMYFYRGYGIHGTYWHNNFGHPMSHGCVNMRTPEAQFVYERVSVGTKVVVHY